MGARAVRLTPMGRVLALTVAALALAVPALAAAGTPHKLAPSLRLTR